MSKLELPNQPGMGTYVQVSALATGEMGLRLRWIFENEVDDTKLEWFPDFSFLIRHPGGKNLLFDLGIRKVSADISYFSF